MNREDIIRMAREAGFNVEKGYLLRITGIDEDLERFAALVASHALVEPCCCNYDQCQKVCMPRAASAEREACANTAGLALLGADKALSDRVLKAIRARGQA